MTKILVTGVTGSMGKSTVEHLLKKGVPANDIIGLARDQEKASDLKAQGIEVREGDYFSYGSLLRAFDGVDKVMLTSAVAFTDRFTQHYNVITAARQAGVKHIVYMAVMRKEGLGHVMPGITSSDLFTEQVLRSSGIDHTIVYHPPFIDTLSVYYGADPYADGISMPSAKGKMAPATRDDLAEAHAEILFTTGHENTTYSLGGAEAITFEDIAEILSHEKGIPVPFSIISEKEYTDQLTSKGLPPEVAEFLTNWVIAIGHGEFEHRSGDLERLLGRPPMTFKEYISSI